MSSSRRRGSSSRSVGEPAFSGMVRRMVSLPRNILGGFSRAMNQGMDLMGIRGRSTNHHLPPNFQYPSNFPYQEPSTFAPQNSAFINDEWAFLSTFEQQYGTTHPFFYACRFMDALRIAQDEHKFVFMYLHSPEHPFTPSFCRETLCSEVVVQFLDANFVCWGGLASSGEGSNMAVTLRASGFPFWAIVALASGDNIAVLQQIEGPVSPEQLVEILQKTIEEKGAAFGISTAKEDEKRMADRRLREEQDIAYLAALHIDQEKERVENKKKGAKKHDASASTESDDKKVNQKSQNTTTKRVTSQKSDSTREKMAELTQILIRFPNGERKEQTFNCTDKIRAIFKYIDSLGLVGDRNYRLISNFPRKLYGVDEMSMSLKDAGLHPKASLFLELL